MSLQDEIDRNPGGTIVVPPGDNEINAPLVIRSSGTVICGAGRIIQTNSDAPIIQITKVCDVTIRDVTLARTESAAETQFQGVNVNDCDRLTLQSLKILDNRTKSSAIRLESCRNCRIQDCYILNYKRVTIEDRSKDPRNGYAFRCIDGTGIHVTKSVGTMILNNQIIERNLLPTKETMQRYHLGELVEGEKPTKFGIFGKSFETNHGTKTWHQGAAIAVTKADESSFTRISGNYLENAAQGIDNQADNYTCTENIVNCGMMGMKAVHGSCNGIVAGNIFSRVDNWGIMLGPGAASYAAQPAHDGQSAKAANNNGNVIVSSNIICDFGRGLEFWNWGGPVDNPASPGAFLLKEGRLPTNPALRHVLIEGNVVTNSEDKLAENGGVQPSKPRYRQAVQMDLPTRESEGRRCPEDVRIRNNILAAGRDGMSSVALPESNSEAYSDAN